MDDKPPPGTVHNVTSHGQRGGITAHTVHVAKPQPRVFGDAEKADLLGKLDRDTPLTVLCPLGDQEATHLATQIHAFLRQSGQSLAQNLVMATMFAQPQSRIGIYPTSNGYDLVVGSND